MPIVAPAVDSRRYQDLLEEALARIPVHTPEWTSFGPADPGVTLIEVFAFLTENLLYRANQIPERNRYKFLDLLGIPLAPAASARGLVTIANDTGPTSQKPLPAGVEVRAGEVPFRIERALDVLAVEARCYRKRAYTDTNGERTQLYKQLYASLKDELPGTDTQIALYQTVAWDGTRDAPIDLGADTIDGCLWIALLARNADRLPGFMDKVRDDARKVLAGKTLSLGIVPALDDADRQIGPTQSQGNGTEAVLRFDVPSLPAGGKLPLEPLPRDASYRTLEAKPATLRTNVLLEPGVLEINLPSSAGELALWSDLDPLEAGSGQFPPALDDTDLAERVITWLRVSSPSASARLLWVGINAAEIVQRDPIVNEVLADGTGEPDQVRVLARPPVLPDSVRLYVSDTQGGWETWQQVKQLADAPPEIHVAAARRGPWSGAAAAQREPGDANVYSLDAESGTLRFGDGLRGRRLPLGTRIRVSYDHSRGDAGNVAAGAIDTAPALPPGFRVVNPVRTWGGVAAETQAEGEKQIPRYLQHGDRLVTAADFESIALRTPGVDVGRVDVLPAFNPDLAPDAPGNSPGSVTLMLIPAYDAAHPQAPEPDRLFMNAVCSHLDARRLVTTELILRGPTYHDLWIGVGIEVIASAAAPAEVRERVRKAVVEFLAPLRAGGLSAPEEAQVLGDLVGLSRGWPLRRAVSAAELAAVVGRVSGVRLVKAVRLADTDGTELPELRMQSLELPRIAGMSVAVGDAPAPRDLMSAPAPSAGSTPAGPKTRLVPVPVIPEVC